jgi:hypothetical protein
MRRPRCDSTIIQSFGPPPHLPLLYFSFNSTRSTSFVDLGPTERGCANVFVACRSTHQRRNDAPRTLPHSLVDPIVLSALIISNTETQNIEHSSSFSIGPLTIYNRRRHTHFCRRHDHGKQRGWATAAADCKQRRGAATCTCVTTTGRLRQRVIFLPMHFLRREHYCGSLQNDVAEIIAVDNRAIIGERRQAVNLVGAALRDNFIVLRKTAPAGLLNLLDSEYMLRGKSENVHTRDDELLIGDNGRLQAEHNREFISLA